MQEQKGKERLIIACSSRVMTVSEKNYSNPDRETLAVVYGVQQFRSYLWGHKFTIYTDNSAVAAIGNQENSTNKRAIRWYIILSEYEFELKHRQGKQLGHGDVLSCYPVGSVEPELSREEERNPAARRARLNSVLREINYLSPSWQEADYVPILDRAPWEEAMKNTEMPAALPEEHPNA